MHPLHLPLLLTPAALIVPVQAPIQIHFEKVAPQSPASGRTPSQDRAVVLIHGLGLHLISADKALHPALRSWQLPQSPLVRRLAQDSDVYALSYSQNATVEEIASSGELRRHLRQLNAAGYKQIVLVGHSAGGLIARQLVEDHPDLGVTRVLQICTPNAGSSWASLKTARGAQKSFLSSLTRSRRTETLEHRMHKRIPDSVDFACVIGSCHLKGDGIVFSRSQWSNDLQEQGIPAFPLRTTHWDAMTNSRTPELIGKLVVEPLPRWERSRVVQQRRLLLGH